MFFQDKFYCIMCVMLGHPISGLNSQVVLLMSRSYLSMFMGGLIYGVILFMGGLIYCIG